MDDMDSRKKLQEYVNENIKLLDQDFETFITSEDTVTVIGIRVKEIVLAYKLFELKSDYETSLWDDLTKKNIVRNVLIVEEQCKEQGLSPFMLTHAYKTVYGCGERLTQFDVDQQEQITKVIDSLHKHVVQP